MAHPLRNFDSGWTQSRSWSVGTTRTVADGSIPGLQRNRGRDKRQRESQDEHVEVVVRGGGGERIISSRSSSDTSAHSHADLGSEFEFGSEGGRPTEPLEGQIAGSKIHAESCAAHMRVHAGGKRGGKGPKTAENLRNTVWFKSNRSSLGETLIAVIGSTATCKVCPRARCSC